MKGQANRNDSFSETFDLHQESPNNSVDRMASLSNRLSPVDSRLSNHRLAHRDGSISSTSCPTNRAQNSRGWEHGESSSRGKNVQEHTFDDDSKMKFAWYSPSGSSSGTDIGSEDWSPEASTTISSSYAGNQVTARSQNVQNYSSSCLPLNDRPNHRHLRENNCHGGLGEGRPHTLYEYGRVGAEDFQARNASSSNLGTSSCSSSAAIENNDVSGPLFGTWGSSCKRKALEGSSRHFHPGATSDSNQPMENIAQHPVTGRSTGSRNLSISSNVPSTDRLEQLNSRNIIGTSRLFSGRVTSSSVQGITENQARNIAVRSSPGHRESVPFDAIGHSTWYASQPQAQPITNSSALELMSPMTLPLNLNNTLNEPYVNVNEAGRTNMYPWNGSSSARRGSSSSSFLLSGERVSGSHEEVNVRSSLRNIPEYPTTVPATDTRNIFDEQIDWSFTPGPSVFSRSYSGSLISPSSGGRSSSTARLPHQNQTSHDQRRYPDAVQWIPFPRIESDSGSQRSPFAPLHLASSAADERATSSLAQHQSDQRPSELSMDARGVNTNSRNLLAAVEGRHRLIRQVLSAMQRGAHLRDEDYMLIDPFVNGFAELHDQHRDMRLDVDNMSYEELLALEEQIGNVSTGLSEEKIRKSMKKRKYKAAKALPEIEPCCICQEDYVGGDDIGILDCEHEFHIGCIKQWLILKNTCPICKNTALKS